jgi:autotransporter adhesin
VNGSQLHSVAQGVNQAQATADAALAASGAQGVVDAKAAATDAKQAAAQAQVSAADAGASAAAAKTSETNAAGSASAAQASAVAAKASADSVSGSTAAAQTAAGDAAGSATAAKASETGAAGSAAAAQVSAQAAQAASKNSVQYDDDSRASVTLNPNGKAVQLHNVADGVEASDAANVGQVTSALNQARSYTDQRFNALSNQIDANRRDASGGIATALAAASIPQAVRPGTNMVGIGVGTWAWQAGFAAGVSHRTLSDRVTLKANLNVSSRGKAGAAVGAGFEF